MSKKSFAGRLKEIRERAGLSQYALAKQSALSKQALSRLELGENEPTWDSVQKLAAALGVDCTAFQVDAPPASTEKPAAKKGKKK